MKNINIGLFGFGCVGQGLYETLNNSKNFAGEITKICIKNPEKKRRLGAELFTTHRDEVINDPKIDIVVELIDDAEAALAIVTDSLKAGKSVVTANKKMVAENLEYLVQLQNETGKAILYEGAVCGSIPIIRTLEEYFGHEPLNEVKGIFNGSTNYILTKIFQERLDYPKALKDAQDLGFAESDPTLDVQGFDPKFKLSILLTHAFGIHVPPQQITNLGIDRIKASDLEYTRANGYIIKLVAQAKRIADQVYGFVIPQFVKPDHALANIHNEFNAVTINGEFCDDQLFIGKGAGSLPTGAAVLSDISALSYDYKYEYKKHYNLGQLPFSNQTPVQVYVSYTSPEEVDLSEFENVQEKYFSFDHCFVIGNICLGKLQKENWRNNKNINLVLTAEDCQKGLGNLCINDLKEEITELRKGQKIRERITI